MSALILSLALVPRPAAAFAPSDDVHIGIEPQRIQYVHPQEQARLKREEPWLAFVKAEGSDWDVRFDEATRTPRHIWGPGIEVDTRSADSVSADAQAFIERHATLLGVEPGQLVPRSTSYVERVDTWYVEFDALRDGLTTYRGGLSARIKHGNLVLLNVATAPAASVTGSQSVSTAAAIDYAIAQGPAPGAEHTERSATPILLERRTVAGHELRHTMQVHTRTQSPPGLWVSFIDGVTGELLNVHNEVRFITGSVEALHHERTVDGSPLVQSPVPIVEVYGDSDQDTTDDFGLYDVATSSQYDTEFNGDYLYVNYWSGPEGLLSSSDADLLWTSSDASQAEIDTYIFLHHVRDWGLRVAPEVGMSTFDLTSNVNIPDVCNAYYDGNVNFFSAGSGCNNTGQIADVNYHEWGHGFHAWSLEAGVWDGSVGEGAADVVAFLLTEDSLIAPFFNTSGSGIRDVSPNQVYPDDISFSVHSNGLIFGGAMWDLWNLLKTDLGESPGTETTEQIHAGLLKGGPDIPGTYFEALVADDDDGNLANGTPHTCQIIEAFGNHGLGDAAGGDAFFADHEPLEREPADIATAVVVDVSSVAPECISVVADGADLNYRINGGEWQSSATSIAGTEIAGEIPAQPIGTFVEYYIGGIDSDGRDFAAPSGGITSPYSFYVGDVVEIAFNDFEADDGGYTHALLSGDVQDGADDWQWGVPQGESNDPSSGFSGSNVWGNDLGDENFNGAYQPDKINRLETPEYETGHYTEVFLQYRRWLQMEDALYDQAIITANGDTVWTNWSSSGGTDHHEEDQWVSHAVDLDGRGDRGTVQLGWEMHSDGGLEFGGWTIDDGRHLRPGHRRQPPRHHRLRGHSGNRPDPVCVDQPDPRPAGAGRGHAQLRRVQHRPQRRRDDLRRPRRRGRGPDHLRLPRRLRRRRLLRGVRLRL